MTLFFILAALLVVLCLLWLLLGLFRTGNSGTDQEAVNITLARERRATLDSALAQGSIDQATYDYEYEQLEYDLAADLRMDAARLPRKGGQLAAAAIVAIFIPVAAGSLYLQLGNPAAITQVRDTPQSNSGDAGAPAADGQQAPALIDLLPQLEQRLASEPEDIEGWRLLGRSYLSINQFDKAQHAFEQALARDENDVATLAQLAEAMAMTRGGELAGEPLAYLERATQIDPLHEHALWLLAIARQQAGEHDAALAGFDQLAQLAQDNPDALATIEQMRSRSLAAMSSTQQGAGAAASAEADADADAGAGADADNDAGVADTDTDTDTDTDGRPLATVQVNVALNQDASDAVAPEHTVFIYARASEGPPMPLAVTRVTVQDLPMTVTLDDSMAMIPSMKLSSFPRVTIGARVSPSGNPIAQSGDWYAEQEGVIISETDSLSLNIGIQKQ